MTPSRWIAGDFEGDFEGLPDPLSGAPADGVSSFNVRLVSGAVRDARKIPDPAFVPAGVFRQATVEPTFIHLPGAEVFQAVLHDVELDGWTTDELGERDGRSYGRLRGRVRGRLVLTEEVAEVIVEAAPPLSPTRPPRPVRDPTKFEPAGCAVLSALGLSWSLVFVAALWVVPALLLATAVGAALLAAGWVLIRLALGQPIVP